jgi:hypothetical protein
VKTPKKFSGGFEGETFFWTRVNPTFDAAQIVVGERVEVERFGKQQTQNADGVLDGTFLPTVEGSTEKRTSVEASVSEEMITILLAVVVGE